MDSDDEDNRPLYNPNVFFLFLVFFLKGGGERQ